MPSSVSAAPPSVPVPRYGIDMKFYATSRLGLFFTDDYTQEEVEQELHIKHLKDDFKNEFPEALRTGLCVRIYDEDDNLVRNMFLYA